jgi:hypothetical protein
MEELILEIKRIKDVQFDSCYETNCIKCNKKIELWWNGGELDFKNCCGLHYSLAHTKLDFVIEEDN